MLRKILNFFGVRGNHERRRAALVRELDSIFLMKRDCEIRARLIQEQIERFDATDFLKSLPTRAARGW